MLIFRYLPFPYLCLLAPLLGTIACLTGSSRLIKWYIDLNATLVIITIPITAITAAIAWDMKIVILLLMQVFVKLGISYFGASVKNVLENP
jgi:hypothetical protein